MIDFVVEPGSDDDERLDERVTVIGSAQSKSSVFYHLLTLSEERFWEKNFLELLVVFRLVFDHRTRNVRREKSHEHLYLFSLSLSLSLAGRHQTGTKRPQKRRREEAENTSATQNDVDDSAPIQGSKRPRPIPLAGTCGQ